MTENGGVRRPMGLISPGIVAIGIIAGAAIVARGAASSAWWTLHAGAIVIGVALLAGAALEMNHSVYPAGAVLASAFLVAVSLLVSATIMGDPVRGGLLVPVWGAGGGFLVLLLPRPGAVPARSGWSLIGGSLLLAAGIVVGTLILAA